MWIAIRIVAAVLVIVIGIIIYVANNKKLMNSLMAYVYTTENEEQQKQPPPVEILNMRPTASTRSRLSAETPTFEEEDVMLSERERRARLALPFEDEPPWNGK